MAIFFFFFFFTPGFIVQNVFTVMKALNFSYSYFIYEFTRDFSYLHSGKHHYSCLREKTWFSSLVQPWRRRGLQTWSGVDGLLHSVAFVFQLTSNWLKGCQRFILKWLFKGHTFWINHVRQVFWRSWEKLPHQPESSSTSQIYWSKGGQVARGANLEVCAALWLQIGNFACEFINNLKCVTFCLYSIQTVRYV